MLVFVVAKNVRSPDRMSRGDELRFGRTMTGAKAHSFLDQIRHD
jgi:hypothetical protein